MDINRAESVGINNYDTVEEIDAFRNGAMWGASRQREDDLAKIKECMDTVLGLYIFDIGERNTVRETIIKSLSEK